MSWYSCECTMGTDTEEKNCWIKSLLLFSLRSKKLLLSHWWQMDNCNNVLTTFLGLECGSCIAVYAGQKAIGFHQKYLNLCSKDERKSYGFGTTWGRVINDRIFIFGWTIPLNVDFRKRHWTQFSDVRATLYWIVTSVLQHVSHCELEIPSAMWEYFW